MYSVCVFVVKCLFVNMYVLSRPPSPPPVGDIRTLQWDTDPSVLQLQADSELGYIFLLHSWSLSDTRNDTAIHLIWRCMAKSNLIVHLKGQSLLTLDIKLRTRVST